MTVKDPHLFTSVDDSENEAEALRDSFREYCELFVDLCSDAQVAVRPYRVPELSHFSQLSVDRQTAALAAISDTVAILGQMKQDGRRLTDSRYFLWRSLRAHGATPGSDLLDMIDDEDVIEVHSFDDHQIFRNLQYFHCVSHTLEDFYCRHWRELGTRPGWAETALAQKAVDVLAGKVSETCALDIAAHVMHELDSERCLRREVKLKFISPLLKDGRVFGTILTHRSKVVGEGATSI